MSPEQQSGIELIAAERERQVTEEEWTSEHDDGHKDNALAWAAVCYAAPGRVYVERQGSDSIAFVDPWPFKGHSDLAGRGFYDWDKRKRLANYVQMPPPGDRLDYLVKAGALIAAEIDRIQRSRS